MPLFVKMLRIINWLVVFDSSCLCLFHVWRTLAHICSHCPTDVVNITFCWTWCWRLMWRAWVCEEMSRFLTIRKYYEYPCSFINSIVFENCNYIGRVHQTSVSAIPYAGQAPLKWAPPSKHWFFLNSNEKLSFRRACHWNMCSGCDETAECK